MTPSDLTAMRASNSSTRYQVTGSFKGKPKRISRIEIEEVITSENRVVASTRLSSDGSFKATTDPLQESPINRLRAVAVYDDEFRACSEQITVRSERTDIQEGDVLLLCMNEVSRYKKS